MQSTRTALERLGVAGTVSAVDASTSALDKETFAKPPAAARNLEHS